MGKITSGRSTSKPIGVAVLGSTGSVGTQALEVIAGMPEQFRVIALAAGRMSPLLTEQSRRFRPEIVAISSDRNGDGPWQGIGALECGDRALESAALVPSAQIVVVATSGHVAIGPTLKAAAAGKEIALANKETIVCAGGLLLPVVRQQKTTLRPVDSEHSAIWQCLGGSKPGAVDRIHLTASGGPFRGYSAPQLASVSVEDALAHPTWSMGGKITVDSATLMNKGLEVIEAHWLFGVPFDRIDVLIHPESIVHSLVEFVDGSQLAQLGLPDMRLPIQYALTYPERRPRSGSRLSLAEVGCLRFEPPDTERFPALRLAREAGAAGGTYPTVLSSADEGAVAAFFDRRLRFVDIPAVIADVLDRHVPEGPLSLEGIAVADRWARQAVEASIARRSADR